MVHRKLTISTLQAAIGITLSGVVGFGSAFITDHYTLASLNYRVAAIEERYAPKSEVEIQFSSIKEGLREIKELMQNHINK